MLGEVTAGDWVKSVKAVEVASHLSLGIFYFVIPTVLFLLHSGLTLHVKLEIK